MPRSEPLQQSGRRRLRPPPVVQLAPLVLWRACANVLHVPRSELLQQGRLVLNGGAVDEAGDGHQCHRHVSQGRAVQQAHEEALVAGRAELHVQRGEDRAGEVERSAVGAEVGEARVAGARAVPSAVVHHLNVGTHIAHRACVELGRMIEAKHLGPVLSDPRAQFYLLLAEGEVGTLHIRLLGNEPGERQRIEHHVGVRPQHVDPELQQVGDRHERHGVGPRVRGRRRERRRRGGLLLGAREEDVCAVQSGRDRTEAKAPDRLG
eukprot:scaffold5925_cov60-Phaeocystis_antarctica.AAC.2